MVTLADLQAIADRLPGVQLNTEERLGMSVEAKPKPKGICWSWNERVELKKPKQENRSVLAVVVPNLLVRNGLIAADPAKFFTEPHYENYPAVLVRLEAIDPRELEELLIEAWRLKASKSLVKNSGL